MLDAGCLELDAFSSVPSPSLPSVSLLPLASAHLEIMTEGGRGGGGGGAHEVGKCGDGEKWQSLKTVCHLMRYVRVPWLLLFPWVGIRASSVYCVPMRPRQTRQRHVKTVEKAFQSRRLMCTNCKVQAIHRSSKCQRRINSSIAKPALWRRMGGRCLSQRLGCGWSLAGVPLSSDMAARSSQLAG